MFLSRILKSFTKKKLFKIHGWLGLNIGLLLFVICISGTFATLSNEIDWLLNPDVQVKGKAVPIAWSSMHENLVQAYPDAQLINLMEQKNSFTEVGDYFAAAALIKEPSGEIRKVHLDPYSGLIKGDGPFLDVQRFFRSYHNNFFDGSRGVYVVTLTSLFLLFSVLTGFMVYGSWLKNLFKLRLTKGSRVLFSDAHRMAGIWSLLFAILIAVTGIWYLAEKIISDTWKHQEILGLPKPKKIGMGELQKIDHSLELLPMSAYVFAAENEFQGFRVEEILLPQKTYEYVELSGQDGNPLTRDRTNTVFVHPHTAEVVFIRKAAELKTPQLINNIVDPLHFGTFGGLGVKFLWFLFGLVLSFSILAGTYLWYLRHSRKLNSKMQRVRKTSKEAGPIEDSRLSVAGISWANMGRAQGAVISASIVLFYLLYTGISTVQDGFRIWSGYPEGYTATISTHNLGPWELDVKCDYPCRMEEGTVIKGSFKSKGIPNYKSLHLRALSNSGDTISMAFKGSSSFPKLNLSREWEEFSSASLQIVAEDYNGNVWSEPVDYKQISNINKKMLGQFPFAPEKNYPDVPERIYVVAGIFWLLVSTTIIVWTIMIVRAAIKDYRLINLSSKKSIEY